MNSKYRIEWPTVGLLALCYVGWGASGLLLYPVAPLLALAAMAVLSALHSSLQHEALHGHPTRDPRVNEVLVSLPLCVFYPYRRFRQMHLQHHRDERLTDPYDDPESWYRDGDAYVSLAAPLKWLLEVNNTLAGRVVIGPALMIFGFYRDEFSRFRRGERGVRKAWLHHAGGLAALALTLEAIGIPLAAYLAVAYAGLSLIAIRTYCEHRWHDRPEGRTLIVERGGLLGALFLNNHLHLVHHKRPRAAWYELPALYRSECQIWHRMNDGYVAASYWTIVRAFAFRRKETVVHPVWNWRSRGVAPGAPFHPKTKPASSRLDGASVPAKPDHD